MLQLLQPISLLAAAGIVVPVIIHLWNTRKGKIRKIGSIKLLQESARSQSRSLRLTDLWLLLLRCLLICALAMLMAKPMWLEKSKTKGWVLLEPSSASQIYPAFQTTIDSLLQNGFECRSFDTSFAPLDLKKIHAADKKDSTMLLPYWSLLKLLDKQVQPTMPLFLFTARELHRFKSDRPELALDLHWQSLPTTDTLSTIVAIQQQAGDSLLQTTLHSSSTAAYFTKERVHRAVFDTANIHQSKIVSDTGMMKVLLYAEAAIDLSYVSAAMQAIKQQTSLPIDVQIFRSTGVQPQGIDWLFWLSEKPLPTGLDANNIFLYQTGKPKEESVFFTASNGTEEPVRFNRLIDDKKNGNNWQPVWTDSKGQSILCRSGTNPVLYSFNSRLRPGWNNLIWKGAFPERLFALLNEGRQPTITDNRSIDPEQLIPSKATGEKSLPSGSLVKEMDLRPYAWLLAFLLFLSERFVSSRKKKKEAYEN